MAHPKILAVYADRVFALLVENKGKTTSVSEMSESLKISFSETLDALVLLRNQNRATQGVNGWQATQ